MTLHALLGEIRRSPGPVTPAALADRLGAPVAEVAAMLAALRASGMIGSTPQGLDCPSAASCSARCPGPQRCPLVGDLGMARLTVPGH